MYVCIYVRMCTVRTYVRMHIYIYMNVCMYVYVCIMYICMCVCMHVLYVCMPSSVTTRTLHFSHSVYLYVPFDSHRTQQHTSFPCTHQIATRWFSDRHRFWALRGTNCALKWTSAEFTSLGCGYLPVCQHGGPVSIPGESVWGLWWTQWHWYKISSDYFGFALSVLFHQCSIFIFMCMVLLAGGQMIEACEPSKNRCISQIRERWIESYCHAPLECREFSLVFLNLQASAQMVLKFEGASV